MSGVDAERGAERASKKVEPTAETAQKKVPGTVSTVQKSKKYSSTPSRSTYSYQVPGCCCCSHINSHNQVRGHRTGSSQSGAEEYPRENTHNPRWYTHISQPTQFMPPPGRLLRRAASIIKPKWFFTRCVRTVRRTGIWHRTSCHTWHARTVTRGQG